MGENGAHGRVCSGATEQETATFSKLGGGPKREPRVAGRHISSGLDSTAAFWSVPGVGLLQCMWTVAGKPFSNVQEPAALLGGTYILHTKTTPSASSWRAQPLTVQPHHAYSVRVVR